MPVISAPVPCVAVQCTFALSGHLMHAFTFVQRLRSWYCDASSLPPSLPRSVHRPSLPTVQMQKRLQQVKESASSPISQADFLDALRKVNPSVGKADLDRFQVWMNEFGSA